MILNRFIDKMEDNAIETADTTIAGNSLSIVF